MLKHQRVINVILTLNPKHSTVPATKKKINSIPAEIRTAEPLGKCKLSRMPVAAGLLILGELRAGPLAALPSNSPPAARERLMAGPGGLGRSLGSHSLSCCPSYLSQITVSKGRSSPALAHR